MNILKPQKSLFGQLNPINNLLDEIEENSKISNSILENYEQKNIEINDITIEKSIIKNTLGTLGRMVQKYQAYFI